MSLNSGAHALKLHDSVVDYFGQLESVALPKARDDIAALRAIRQNNDTFLTDRHVNLIFKNKALLKSAKQREKARKKKKKRKREEEEEESSASLTPEEEEDPSALFLHHETPTMSERGFTPKRFVWTNEAIDDLMRRAKEHQSYLRKLRGRTWDKLTTTEQLRINEYIRETEQFATNLESQKEYYDYMSRAVPLLEEIKTLTQEAREDTQTLHTCEKSVTYNRTETIEAPEPEESSTALIPTSTTSSALVVAAELPLTHHEPNIIEACMITSESHRRLTVLMREFQSLVDYTMNLYGDIRGSGTVVENPHVPTAAVPPQTLYEERDPLLICGLMCADCGIMRLIDTKQAIATCPQCATTVPYQGNGEENFNFGDKPLVEKTKQKNYKPESYMLKWLHKVQGKLGTDIPEEVWELLFSEFHRKRLHIVKAKIVRQTLKRHKLTQYYNCVPFITYKFNEVPLADFSDEEENILAERFDEYRTAFKKCPYEIKQRSNLLSYAYFLYKTVEELGWTHYKQCFPLLEGENHIRKHDRTWKWICENKDGKKWRFIPTL